NIQWSFGAGRAVGAAHRMGRGRSMIRIAWGESGRRHASHGERAVGATHRFRRARGPTLDNWLRSSPSGRLLASLVDALPAAAPLDNWLRSSPSGRLLASLVDALPAAAPLQSPAWTHRGILRRRGLIGAINRDAEAPRINHPQWG